MKALPSSAYDVARAVSVSSVQATVVSRPRVETRLGADVHQQERARAERALGVARLGAVLPEQRRLLIAGDAGDRDAVGQAGHALGLGETPRRRADLGQHRRRHAEQRAQLGIEAPRSNVEQQRARRVGDVGRVASAAREPPDQEAVDGAERDRAGLGARAQARRRCRASTAPSSPRSTDPAPGRSARAARARGPRPSARRTAAPCAGPARRSRCRPDGRRRGPRAASSRAGW